MGEPCVSSVREDTTGEADRILPTARDLDYNYAFKKQLVGTQCVYIVCTQFSHAIKFS